MESLPYGHEGHPITSRRMDPPLFVRAPPTGLDRDIRHPAQLSFSVPPHAPRRWYRNINLFSIAYAFRPRLRIRLTLGGLTWPRKP
jgi:hypothetical protein